MVHFQKLLINGDTDKYWDYKILYEHNISLGVCRFLKTFSNERENY